MRLRDIFSMYASGLVELIFACFGFAIVAALCLKLVGLLFGVENMTSETILFIWQSLVFLALWPGQSFWTIQRQASCGKIHSIIGVPSDDDLALHNRRIARRIHERARD